MLEWQNFDSNIESVAPPPGHALVRIIAAGIAGPDNIQRAGGYPHPTASQPGFTPGYDIVGEVVTVSSSDVATTTAPQDDEEIRRGHLVASMCMFGAHGTHVTLPLSILIKLPPNLSSADLIKITALPLNYMTAMGMLRHVPDMHPLNPGSSILIGSAAGGVGTALAQIVRAFDMNLTMYGTCSANKFGYVRDTLGITPIDRRAHADDFGAVVKALTGGRGVDVAFDAVGSEISLRESARATCSKDGNGVNVVGIGIMDDIKPDGSGMNFPDAVAVYIGRLQDVGAAENKSLTWFGVHRDYADRVPAAFKSDFGALLQTVLEGKLDPVVSKLMLLRDAVRAHEMLIEGTGIMGKMVFVVDGKAAKELGVV